MPRCRLGAPLLAAAMWFAAAKASADNIAWTYESRAETEATGSPNPAPVAHVITGVSGPGVGGHTIVADLFGTDPASPILRVGSDTIFVGQLLQTGIGPDGSLPRPFQRDGSYTFRLSLADAASGQTGAVRISGVLQTTPTEGHHPDPQPGDFGIIPIPGGGKLLNDFTSPAEVTLALGGHRYDVRFRFEAFDEYSVQSGALFADVVVSETPEPSGLALLGIGFVAAAAAWRRIRCRRCGGE